MANSMVTSARSDTGHILSEQQNPVFRQKPVLHFRTLENTMERSENILYDVKLCVDSESAVKNVVAPRNPEISAKNVFYFLLLLEVFSLRRKNRYIKTNFIFVFPASNWSSKSNVGVLVACNQCKIGQSL